MLFISHASEEAQAARELARHLRTAGHWTWVDVENLRPGDPWQEKIEAAVAREASAFVVYVGRGGVQRWVDLEVRTAIARHMNDAERRFRILTVLGPGSSYAALPAFLQHFQWVDASAGMEGAVERLREALEAPLVERASILPPDRPPFMGLRPFDEEQAELFFGRDQEVAELLRLMARKRLVAVVGDSGSGKSSLVRAGLLPALRRGRFGSSRGEDRPWRVAILRPGSDPMDGVVRGLPQLAPWLEKSEVVDLQGKWRSQLAQGPERLVDCALLLLERNDRALIVVDQFEEVFAKEVSNERREWFLRALMAAADQRGDQDLHVLFTLRYDFLPRCFEHPLWWERMKENQLDLRRLPRERMREVIQKPVAIAGLEIPDSLVDALLDAAGDEPGNLALLEFALFQMWQARELGQISHEHLSGMGGLEGLLDRHADGVYADLTTEAQRALARRALVKLTHVEGARDTRRRLERATLLPELGGDSRAAEAVLEILVRERLLTAGQESIEIAHEALIRHWRKLVGWLDESRERERLERRLAPQVQDWLAHRRDSTYLLGGGQLAEVETWFQRERSELGSALVEFLDTSLAERERRAAEERERTRQLAVTNERLLRLSDLHTLRALEGRADGLWPAHPARRADLVRWVREARELISRLEEHRRTLDEIRTRGEWTGTRWHFGDRQDTWWHDSQAELVTGLEALAHPETGLCSGTSELHGPGIERRLATARTIEEDTVTGEDARRRWERALASIARECPPYGGLRLRPELGLLPLGDGPNPASGLWEFAVHGTGSFPERDPHSGRIRMEAESALVLVLLPGGSFSMGAQSKDRSEPNFDPGADSDEIPVKKIALAPFFLSRFQVTQGQWSRLMGRNPSYWSPNGQPQRIDLRHPVEQVDWNGSRNLCERLDLDLPTEAQWEYACRAGSSHPFHHGEDVAGLVRYANVKDQAYARLFRDAGSCEEFDDGHGLHAPVGSYEPNRFGLHDMHGNVWEWCRDGYGSYDLPVREGDGERLVTGAAHRVYRGGSFALPARYARSASRFAGVPSRRVAFLGFRPAKGITPV